MPVETPYISIIFPAVRWADDGDSRLDLLSGNWRNVVDLLKVSWRRVVR